jgi:prepilin-type N-terminal cleavage/methylation domain-containing protein
MEMENNLKTKKSESQANHSPALVNALSVKTDSRFNSNRGFSLVELLIVCAVVGIISTVAIPQMINQRRLLRSTAVTREFQTQLRYARQLAMSERQAITFQYDDDLKQIRIIDHNNDPASATSGTAVLADPSYPSTASPAAVVLTVDLTQGGLTSAEIRYGAPTTSTGLPSGHLTVPTTLADGTALTSLSATSTSGNKVNITFQADGSVVSRTGVPLGGITLSQGARLDAAMFIFNNRAAAGTASAISVLGSSGRVKVWRYVDNATNIYVQ